MLGSQLWTAQPPWLRNYHILSPTPPPPPPHTHTYTHTHTHTHTGVSLECDSDSESSDEPSEQVVGTPDKPKVILDSGCNVKDEKGSRISAAMRRARMKVLAMKHYSPTNSPNPSPRASPRASPLTSPTRSPRGVRKKLGRGGAKVCVHLTKGTMHCTCDTHRFVL